MLKEATFCANGFGTKVWKVKVDRSLDVLVFTEGWDTFMKDIKVGERWLHLLFHHIGGMHFYVTRFNALGEMADSTKSDLRRPIMEGDKDIQSTDETILMYGEEIGQWVVIGKDNAINKVLAARGLPRVYFVGLASHRTRMWGLVAELVEGDIVLEDGWDDRVRAYGINGDHCVVLQISPEYRITLMLFDARSGMMFALDGVIKARVESGFRSLMDEKGQADEEAMGEAIRSVISIHSITTLGNVHDEYLAMRTQYVREKGLAADAEYTLQSFEGRSWRFDAAPSKETIFLKGDLADFKQANGLKKGDCFIMYQVQRRTFVVRKNVNNGICLTHETWLAVEIV